MRNLWESRKNHVQFIDVYIHLCFPDTHVWVFKVIYLQWHSRHLLSAYQRPVPCSCKPIRPAALSMQALFMFMFKICTVYVRLTLIAVIVSNSVSVSLNIKTELYLWINSSGLLPYIEVGCVCSMQLYDFLIGTCCQLSCKATTPT